eukprot:2972176-Lingulodinium_polyedra.AAC.1
MPRGVMCPEPIARQTEREYNQHVSEAIDNDGKYLVPDDKSNINTGRLMLLHTAVRSSAALLEAAS